MLHQRHDPTKPLPPAPPGCGSPMLNPYGQGPRDKPARDWLAHLEAGRIGTQVPADPEVVARRMANEAALRWVMAR